MKPPIPDPFEKPQIRVLESETRVFHLDLWRVFKGTLPFMLLITLIVWAIVSPIRGYGKVVFAFASLSVSLASSILPALFFKIQVMEAGLKAPNAWYFSRVVNWADIRKVRYCWVFWSYLLISTPTKRDFIWLPLYLSDKKGFAQSIEEWAPEDNPLRLFLEKRNF